MLLQVHVLDAVTGKLIFAFSPKDTVSMVAPRSLAITAYGDYVAVAVGGNQVFGFILRLVPDPVCMLSHLALIFSFTLFVVVLFCLLGSKVTKKLRCPPIDLGLTLMLSIDANGDYIAYGYRNATVAKWDAAAS